MSLGVRGYLESSFLDLKRHVVLILKKLRTLQVEKDVA